MGILAQILGRDPDIPVVSQMDRLYEVLDPNNAFPWEKSHEAGKVHYDFQDTEGRDVRVTMHAFVADRIPARFEWTGEARGKKLGRIELLWPGRPGPLKWIPKPTKNAETGLGNRTLATVVAITQDYMATEGGEAIAFAYPPSRMRPSTFLFMKPGQDKKLTRLFTTVAEMVARRSSGDYEVAHYLFSPLTKRVNNPLNDGYALIVPKSWIGAPHSTDPQHEAIRQAVLDRSLTKKIFGRE